MSSRDHVRELDGVRGVAILLVLAVHFTPNVAMPNRAAEWFRKAIDAGWVGVDLFFVLSGFLITGILLRTKGRPNALKIFFMRRMLRIFPLYGAALVGVFLVLPLAMRAAGVGVPPEFGNLLHDQWWAWLHSTNLGIYFLPAGSFQSSVVSITHFWSLSIEEHFYLIWPFVVFGLSRQRLKILCLIIMGGALFLRLAGIALGHPHFVMLDPCRIDALAIGSYLAVFSMEKPISNLHRRALIALGISGAILLVHFIRARGLWSRSSWVQGVGLSFIAVFFASALIIVLSSDENTWISRACRSSVLCFFGKYSYGIYVIHALLADQLNRLLPFGPVSAMIGSTTLAVIVILLIKVTVSVAAALVSWHALERPALRLKAYFEIDPETPTRPALRRAVAIPG
jgi:peptidoglycan/LPS O-acetylase OafA/YrhL